MRSALTKDGSSCTAGETSSISRVSPNDVFGPAHYTIRAGDTLVHTAQSKAVIQPSAKHKRAQLLKRLGVDCPQEKECIERSHTLLVETVTKPKQQQHPLLWSLAATALAAAGVAAAFF